MQLNEIMSDREQEVIKSFIKAHEVVEFRRIDLRSAEQTKREFAKLLTEVWAECDENDQPISTIPDRFVVRHRDELYLIEIDDEGNYNHKISRVAGILA